MCGVCSLSITVAASGSLAPRKVHNCAAASVRQVPASACPGGGGGGCKVSRVKVKTLCVARRERGSCASAAWSSRCFRCAAAVACAGSGGASTSVSARATRRRMVRATAEADRSRPESGVVPASRSRSVSSGTATRGARAGAVAAMVGAWSESGRAESRARLFTWCKAALKAPMMPPYKHASLQARPFRASSRLSRLSRSTLPEKARRLALPQYCSARPGKANSRALKSIVYYCVAALRVPRRRARPDLRPAPPAHCAVEEELPDEAHGLVPVGEPRRESCSVQRRISGRKARRARVGRPRRGPRRGSGRLRSGRRQSRR